MIEVNFNAWGENHRARFERSQYVNNGNLYIGVSTWSEEWGAWEPWCDLTVNLGIETAKNEAFIDTNNCSPDLINVLFEKGYMIDTGIVRPSGFCIYPLARFTNEFLKGIED